MMQFAQDAWHHLRHNQPNRLLFVLAIALYAIWGLLLSPMASPEVSMALLLPISIAFMVIQYFLARQIGGAGTDDTGSVGRWFGWGLLSGILMILPYSAFLWFAADPHTLEPKLDILWVGSAILAAGAALVMPLFIISVARAIDANSPPTSLILAECRKDYVGLTAGTFAWLLIPGIASDYLLSYAILPNLPRLYAVVLAAIGGLFLLVITVAQTSIAAHVLANLRASPSNSHSPD